MSTLKLPVSDNLVDFKSPYAAAEMKEEVQIPVSEDQEPVPIEDAKCPEGPVTSEEVNLVNPTCLQDSEKEKETTHEELHVQCSEVQGQDQDEEEKLHGFRMVNGI